MKIGMISDSLAHAKLRGMLMLTERSQGITLSRDRAGRDGPGVVPIFGWFTQGFDPRPQGCQGAARRDPLTSAPG